MTPGEGRARGGRKGSQGAGSVQGGAGGSDEGPVDGPAPEGEGDDGGDQRHGGLQRGEPRRLSSTS